MSVAENATLIYSFIMSTDNDKTIVGMMETMKHIQRVRYFLWLMERELDERARNHDQTKLESPEKEVFGEHTPELSRTPYMTPAYTELLAKVQPALDHHYSRNRHHPEHWPNGVNDMTLIDLVEMLCDWKAATERVKDGNIRMSITKNADRYKISEQLTQIFENTVRELFQD